MRPSPRLARLLLALALLLTLAPLGALTSPASAATTFQVSGTITGQASAAVVGATVSALDTGGATVAGATTGADGRYALSVAAGTYDIQVSPPAGSPYQVATIRTRTISADTTIDIALVSASAVTLSGRVVDKAGNGVAGVSLTITPATGGAGVSTTSAANGGYSLALAPGSYSMRLFNSRLSSVGVPYYLDLYTRAFTIQANTSLDLPLPLEPVRVRVQDGAGNPVANVRLDSNYQSQFPPLQIGALTLNNGSIAEMSRTTDANGQATLWLFPTRPEATGSALYTLTARPPSGSLLA
ncbi:MAG: carboxypeptidase regulatory-like domain-containing protein, partial [Oscillochloris sp.]|nr:carboxypeptidase regulatory-like domain-containing protein [Oscillochloris sp.]